MISKETKEVLRNAAINILSEIEIDKDDIEYIATEIGKENETLDFVLGNFDKNVILEKLSKLP